MSPAGLAISNRERFLETAETVQATFESHGIDFRILGSLATYSYVPDASPLDFARKGAYTPDQAIPDIDILVPRGSIECARSIREDLMQSRFPVKLGLAASVNTLDFLPESETSYLTHKTRRQPFRSTLFDARIVTVPGSNTTIKTLAPQALLHTYVTCGGLLRSKDRDRVDALARQSSGCHQEFRVFHDFIRQRRQQDKKHLPLAVAKDVVRRLPNPIENRIKHIALGVADRLALR